MSSLGGPLATPGGPPVVRRKPARFSWRATLIALVSTLVVFGGLIWVVIHAPNWPAVQEAFFDGPLFWYSLPLLIAAFVKNIELFLIAEALILPIGLVLAVCRGLPGPVFFPVRALSTAYVDIFRALPGILVIYVLGFGVPGLGLPGVPTDPFFWAIVALTLIYSAYVSEVYRSGIESVHPSQEAAARSLGMSRFQALRHVILPQAVRRVVAPLLNDFIGLQKDTVLVSIIGVVEIFRRAEIIHAAQFNFTPYLGVALVFIVVTIPLARFTDWLVARDKRRGASVATQRVR
jgi:polar amino acid transport system permease protein